MKSLGPKTIITPVPLWVLGTYDQAGRPNIMTAAWCGICCTKPPCVSVSLQKVRHSLHGFTERKAFTVGVPSEDHLKQADYAGIATGRTADKFAVTGLTPVRSELVDAPLVGEFPLSLECRVVQQLDLGSHFLFVGEIVDVKAAEGVLDEKDLPDLLKMRPFLFDPGRRSYHAVGPKLAQAFSAGKVG